MTQIYVALLDEPVDVWRPVEAQLLSDSTYLILDQPYDRSIEKWEFEPGDEVACEWKELFEGKTLVAVRKAR